jgi:D-amino-acid oxidase
MQQSLVKFSQAINKSSYNTYTGVSGLTTATLLLQQEKAIKVHIVAKHFPGDLSGEYTSPWYI